MFGNLKRSLIITHTALFIAIIAIFSWISIPFPPVPVTLQTLAVLLTGAIMRRYAIIPVALYLILGAAGLPVFHNGTAGLGILLGPTGGYLIGFIPAAFILGLCYERESRMMKAAGFIGAEFFIYFCGVFWLIGTTGMDMVPALFAGFVPFIPGDIIKAIAAYLITDRVDRQYGRFLGA